MDELQEPDPLPNISLHILQDAHNNQLLYVFIGARSPAPYATLE